MKQSSGVKQTLKIFWQFTRPNQRFFWIGTIGAAIGVIAGDVLPPLVIAKAFDHLQSTAGTGNPLYFADFAPYVYTYLAITFVSVVVWRTQIWFVWRYEIPAIRNIAVHIFDHLQRLGSRFHADRFGGALVSQTNKFLTAYEKVMDEFTWSVTTGIVAFVASFLVLAFNALWFALIFLVISVVYFRIMYWRTTKTMPFDRALAASESERTAKLADMITNVSAVNSFAGEIHEKKLFERQADNTVQHYWGLLRKVMVNDAMSHGMTGSISLVAFTAGILAITTFNLPAGVLFLSVSYTMQLTRRLWEANRVMRHLNRSFGDAADMTAILQLTPEIADKPGAKALRVARGDIRLDMVDFGYADQREMELFKSLNLHVKPGEKVGLVGHSGGGKTTITKLLLRSVEINKGRILIDGQNIADVTQSSLRAHIASVPQEPMLFHRSLADNIAYGRPGASLKEIKAVAKMAHADEFIGQLPDGYETLVGERGVKLSGGQRQRVAIARAMIKNAPILVLDEATSALDSASEALIQDALWKLMGGRTAIVIAHRLSTIQRMDRIIVMDEGRIAEEGTHKELLNSDGIYANLWNHQSGGFLED